MSAETPPEWEQMTDQEKFKWVIGNFNKENNLADKPEMYCLKCKIFLKFVDLHLDREHPGISDISFIITKEEYEGRRYAEDPKFAKPKGSWLWFWGIDPARERDYHTVVINGLPSKRTDPWLPLLKDLYRFKKQTYIASLNWMIKDLAIKYPPTLAHVDATRDPTFAEILVNKFGRRMVPLKFQNVGNQNTKFDLKLIGKAYLDQGYSFPDVDMLLRKKRISPDKAFLVKELKIEALRELVKLTSTDRITFDQVKHNDLVHAEEMSLKGVMEYQKGKIGVSMSAISSIHGSNYSTTNPQETAKEKIEKTLMARFAKRNLGQISRLQINLPEDKS